jgi:AcrR family transcriptional regulator
VSAGGRPDAGGRADAGGRPDAGAVPPQIVDAARQVLAQDGLAAATLERISAAAGISRMTLHRRGVSKRDILDALAQRHEADYREAIWPALVAVGSGRERLVRALELLCDVTERNLALLGALADGRAATERDGAPAARLNRAVFVEPLARLLLDGAADGSLARLDAQETATLLLDAVGHAYRQLRVGRGWAPERARSGITRLVIGGVLAAPQAPAAG